MDDAVISTIDSMLQHHHDRDDAMKALFFGARNSAQYEIAELLSDFRQKRSLGGLGMMPFLDLATFYV